MFCLNSCLFNNNVKSICILMQVICVEHINQKFQISEDVLEYPPCTLQ